MALSLYLFGLLRFKHEGPAKKLTKLRVAFGLFFAAFTFYLVPGLTNTKHANRALISGFPPPLTYSVYGKKSGSAKGVEANVLNDYEKALQLAKETGKPLLIDFTGWACVNCRKMEENVWTQPDVQEAIEKVQPFGVDICSGVRTMGKLDPSKLSSFIEAVHSI